MPELIPLTVLEKFLFWEDRPAYPWCAFCKFEFDGELDSEAFEQAATDALKTPCATAIKNRQSTREVALVCRRKRSGANLSGPSNHPTEFFLRFGISI